MDILEYLKNKEYKVTMLGNSLQCRIWHESGEHSTMEILPNAIWENAPKEYASTDVYVSPESFTFLLLAAEKL